MVNKCIVITIAIFVFIIIPSCFLLGYSFSSLDATTYGLNYNNNLKEIENNTYTSGLYFLGVGHWFITFPKTLQTIDWSSDSDEDDALACLTSDGLPVTLEVSFQYQLSEDLVYDLYMAYGDNWNEIFESVGQNVLQEVASEFTAYEFFSNQTQIGNDMREALDDAFSAELYSTVSQFQLKQVTLPDAFEDAIEDTIIASQTIQQAQFQYDTAEIDAQTTIIQTSYDANITIITAQAAANQSLAIAQANADAEKALLVAEALALQIAVSQLGLNSSQLDLYIFLQAIAIQDNSELFIAMDPSTQYTVGGGN